MEQPKNNTLKNDYTPRSGDVLSLTNEHPFVIVEFVYALPKTGIRINKNYDKEYMRYLALQKIIHRKEIIWIQHRHDLSMYPETPVIVPKSNPGDLNSVLRDRESMTYRLYCLLNRPNEYMRLYNSQYFGEPKKEKRMIIGEKMMLKTTHKLCNSFPSLEGEIVENSLDGNTNGLLHDFASDILRCNFRGGDRSLPLSYFINRGYKYLGNIYQEIFTHLNPINNG